MRFRCGRPERRPTGKGKLSAQVSSNGSRHAVLLLTLAGAIGFAEPAAARLDNGVLSIFGQRGENADYLQLDAEFSDGYEGTEAMEEGSGFTLALEREGAEQPELRGVAAPGRIARTIVLTRSAAAARGQRVTLAYAGSGRFAPAKVSRRVRRARR
jgi:hypothetical protein